MWWFSLSHDAGPYCEWMNQLIVTEEKCKLCTSPPDLCVHGPAACGSWKVVPGSTGWAVLYKFSDLLPARAIHPSGRSHWTAGPGLAAAGHGSIGQSRCFGTLYYWEFLLLPGEWMWLRNLVHEVLHLDVKSGFGEDVITSTVVGLFITERERLLLCNMTP